MFESSCSLQITYIFEYLVRSIFLYLKLYLEQHDIDPCFLHDSYLKHEQQTRQRQQYMPAGFKRTLQQQTAIR